MHSAAFWDGAVMLASGMIGFGVGERGYSSDAWFREVVDWLVSMTGRVGCPHSMVQKAEFFACARVTRLC